MSKELNEIPNKKIIGITGKVNIGGRQFSFHTEEEAGLYDSTLALKIEEGIIRYYGDPFVRIFVYIQGGVIHEIDPFETERIVYKENKK